MALTYWDRTAHLLGGGAASGMALTGAAEGRADAGASTSLVDFASADIAPAAASGRALTGSAISSWFWAAASGKAGSDKDSAISSSWAENSRDETQRF